ncbi:MAG TPA: DUF4465 domain-containing protein [Saprospiraceae bacterium]|nr:DUF4465 domain-containing protein [Saprospiraceae bacterium]HMQ81952.1 DUF4465 domain-containing protein [Saprospiraceae bacterium]
MKLLFLLFSLMPFLIQAQTKADFENIPLANNSFLNDAGGTGLFESGHIALPNDYNADFDFWSGWAISSVTDNETPGFLNQYSAIAGGGAEGTANYALTYAFDPVVIRLENEAAGGAVEGVYITNSTYAYFSMLEGDGFAKKFGGETGNDPDFFLLQIQKYEDGQLHPETISFYLADYRFENNGADYIVDEWTYIDLSPLGNMDSLSFSLSSSDVGIFGMNTPAYFCLDQLITLDMPSADTYQNKPSWQYYPNPASNFLILNWPETNPAQLRVMDVNGKMMASEKLQSGKNEISLEPFPSGIYWMQIRRENGSFFYERLLIQK